MLFLTELSPAITSWTANRNGNCEETGLQDYRICLCVSVDRLPNVRILSILSILSIVLFLTELLPAITSWTCQLKLQETVLQDRWDGTVYFVGVSVA